MGWNRHPVRTGLSPRTRRFVESVRRSREAAGLSRESLAAVVAVVDPDLLFTSARLRSLELGLRATLTLDEAMAIATALGTTVVLLVQED